jgi:Orange carotenoid protein, N-terminal
MTSSFNEQIPQALTSQTQSIVEKFNKLSTDSKLAWFYLVYQRMGDSITRAAPLAAEPELAPMLVQDYLEFSNDQQLQIMREIVEGTDTDYSRTYGALKDNNQLLIWYIWAEAMGDKVVGMPNNYQASESINDLLSEIEKLEFEGQMSVFRTIVNQMGHSKVKPIETQAVTGKTSSL